MSTLDDICEEFLRNSNINPRTRRSISKDGPTHRALTKECGLYVGNVDFGNFEFKDVIKITTLEEKELYTPLLSLARMLKGTPNLSLIDGFEPPSLM